MVGIGAALAYLGFIFWLIFYADDVANNSIIMRARSTYQEKYWDTLSIFRKPSSDFPPFKPIYTLQAESFSKEYSYTFFGTYYGSDSDGNIVLTGYDGRNYVFEMSQAYIDQGISGNPKQIITPTSDRVSIGTGPLIKGDKITVHWGDSRTLKQIKENYAKDPLDPLNKYATEYFSFARGR